MSENGLKVADAPATTAATDGQMIGSRSWCSPRAAPSRRRSTLRPARAPRRGGLTPRGGARIRAGVLRRAPSSPSVRCQRSPNNPHLWSLNSPRPF